MGRNKGFDPDRAVDQAMAVFWSNRFANTTPRGLADAIGIGPGSLYNAFSSKRTLFELALHRYFEQETARLIEVLEAPGGPVRERLRDALDLVVAAARDDAGQRGCLITNTAVEFAGRDPDIERLVRRFLGRQEAAFRSAVEEGVRSGEIAPDRDSGSLAAFFLATINGIRILAQADPASPRLDGLVDVALRAL